MFENRYVPEISAVGKMPAIVNAYKYRNNIGLLVDKILFKPFYKVVGLVAVYSQVYEFKISVGMILRYIFAANFG